MIGPPFGLRLYTRYDYTSVFEQRLADYVMPDILWTGGISEIKKIAAMAEAYYVCISPHDALGPVSIVAGAHASITMPNFYASSASTSGSQPSPR